MFHSLNNFVELHEIIFFEYSLVRHMSKQHFHRYQISQNLPLVSFARFVTMFKCKSKVLLRFLEIVVKHVLPTHVILVSDLLGFGILVLQGGGFNCPNDNEVYILVHIFSGPKGWSPKFATGLNVIIGIDQKIYMGDRAILLPK